MKKETSYTLRGVPLTLWGKIKNQATLRGITINQLILDILTKWTKKDKEEGR